MSRKKKDKVDAKSPFAKLAELKKRMAADEELAAKTKNPPKAKPGERATARAATPSPSRDEDEAMTFHRMMSGVVPLDEKRAERLVAGKKAQEQENAAAKEHLRDLAFGVERFEVQDDGRHVEGRRVDVPPDVVRKLRRGQLPIDARLDLHGMVAAQAKAALATFLKDKRARGERVALVIHGRGEHSVGPPVLRGEIAAWLSQGPASEHVAAFTTATGADGGEGALYVLLRR